MVCFPEPLNICFVLDQGTPILEPRHAVDDDRPATIEDLLAEAGEDWED